MLRNLMILVLSLLVTIGLFAVLFGGLIWQSKAVSQGQLPVREREKLQKQMKAELSSLQYRVLYEQDTERAFTSPLLEEKRSGTYVTVDTELPVFRSEDKYESGTGWPSFSAAVDENIILREDNSLFTRRTEVISRDTGVHLGHLFQDGPEPTGDRYCINGAALKFIPD